MSSESSVGRSSVACYDCVSLASCLVLSQVMQGGLVSPVVPAHRQGARFWQLPSCRLIAPKFLSLCFFWVRRGALGMSASSSMPLPRPLGLALSLLLFVAARFFADRQ